MASSITTGGHVYTKLLHAIDATYSFKIEPCENKGWPWFQIIINTDTLIKVGSVDGKWPFSYNGANGKVNNTWQVDKHKHPSTIVKLIIKNSFLTLEINGKVQNMKEIKIPSNFYIIADIYNPTSKITIL